MLRLAADADVDGPLIRGLLRRRPDLDLVRAQDALPDGTPDPEVLEWAASDNRVLITRDRRTMTASARQRVAAGLPMPGLIVTNRKQKIRAAIDDILLIAEYLSAEDVRDQFAIFLPHRG